MNESIYLSEQDVRITCGGLQRPAAQKAKLDELGIRYAPSGNGSPLVLIATINKLHGIKNQPVQKKANFAALEAVS